MKPVRPKFELDTRVVWRARDDQAYEAVIIAVLRRGPRRVDYTIEYGTTHRVVRETDLEMIEDV